MLALDSYQLSHVFFLSIFNISDFISHLPLYHFSLHFITRSSSFQNLFHHFIPDNYIHAQLQYLFIISLSDILSTSHVILFLFVILSGTADFVPRRVSHDMESFNSTLGQAREWLNQQQGIRFINVQSIDYKLKRDWGG